MRYENGDNEMKRSVVCLVTTLLLLGVAGAMYFFATDPAKAWEIQGDTFCNKRYSICLKNEPKWVPVFSRRSLPGHSKELLALAKPVFDMDNARGFAHIVVTPVESTVRDNIRIIKPLTYLQMLINPMRRKYFKFDELQAPSVGFLNGKEVAMGQFLSAAHSNSKPAMSLSYAFVNGKQGCSIIYFASPNQFEKNRDDAMRIIRSFKFGRQEIEKNEKK